MYHPRQDTARLREYVRVHGYTHRPFGDAPAQFDEALLFSRSARDRAESQNPNEPTLSHACVGVLQLIMRQLQLDSPMQGEQESSMHECVELGGSVRVR
jgi:hypothetical protein